MTAGGPRCDGGAGVLRGVGARLPRGLRHAGYLLPAGFAAFLVAQHAQVFPLHDDWGFSVLGYLRAQPGFVSHDFGLVLALKFVAEMYVEWSGRISSLFLEAVLLRLGLWWVRLFQVAAILAASFFAVRIARRASGEGRRSPWLWALPIVLYVSIPRSAYIGGIFWFAASAGYLWGVPFLLAAADRISRRRALDAVSSLLLAFSCTFHEQMAVAAVAFAVSHLALDRLHGSSSRSLPRQALLVLPTIATACATILAPGNFARRSVSPYPSGSAIDVALSDLSSLSDKLLGSAPFLWIILVSLVALGVGVFLASGRSLASGIAAGAGPVAVLLAYVLLPRPAFGLCLLGAYAYLLFRACRASSDGLVVFSTFVAALGTYALLVVSPGVAWRSLIPSYFLLFVPVSYSILALRNAGALALAAAALAVIFVPAARGAAEVYAGYRTNARVHALNDAALRAASAEAAQGIDFGDTVQLFRLPEPVYAETMPYERPLIGTWMKRYYGLDERVRLEWRDPPRESPLLRPPPCARDIAFRQRAAAYASEGLSAVEPWGRWTDGSIARIACRLPDGMARPRSIVLEGRGYAPGGAQDVRVVVDGRDAGTHSFPDGRTVSLRLEVPAGPGPELVLQLDVAHPSSPREHGESGDPRRLGVGLVRMRLE